jgi:hypothetical protein
MDFMEQRRILYLGWIKASGIRPSLYPRIPDFPKVSQYPKRGPNLAIIYRESSKGTATGGDGFFIHPVIKPHGPPSVMGGRSTRRMIHHSTSFHARHNQRSHSSATAFASGLQRRMHNAK